MGIKDITICASSHGQGQRPHRAHASRTAPSPASSPPACAERSARPSPPGKLKRPGHHALPRRASAGHREPARCTSTSPSSALPPATSTETCGPTAERATAAYCPTPWWTPEYADKVVAITDCLVPFPNVPASISMVDVDYVCVVDEIGNPAKIATGAAKPTTDVRKIMMADYCTQFVIHTPYFKDGLFLPDRRGRSLHRLHHFPGKDHGGAGDPDGPGPGRHHHAPCASFWRRA